MHYLGFFNYYIFGNKKSSLSCFIAFNIGLYTSLGIQSRDILIYEMFISHLHLRWIDNSAEETQIAIKTLKNEKTSYTSTSKG